MLSYELTRYRELNESGKLGYNHFVELFDEIERLKAAKVQEFRDEEFIGIYRSAITDIWDWLPSDISEIDRWDYDKLRSTFEFASGTIINARANIATLINDKIKDSL